MGECGCGGKCKSLSVEEAVEQPSFELIGGELVGGGGCQLSSVMLCLESVATRVLLSADVKKAAAEKRGAERRSGQRQRRTPFAARRNTGG